MRNAGRQTFCTAPCHLNSTQRNLNLMSQTRSLPLKLMLKLGDRVQLNKDAAIAGLPMNGKGLTGEVKSINRTEADVTFDVGPLGAAPFGTLPISGVSLSKLVKVEPKPSPPPSTKKNKAAAPEQPEAAKRARSGGKEPAAASTDTPRAGTIQVSETPKSSMRGAPDGWRWCSGGDGGSPSWAETQCGSAGLTRA